MGGRSQEREVTLTKRLKLADTWTRKTWWRLLLLEPQFPEGDHASYR